jgi:hypothetical protein
LPNAASGIINIDKANTIMEPYRVFISSIMNRSIEDLLLEREAARAAVEHFAPITVPWAFEAEPASAKPLLDFYIDAAKTSDLFVLIVGQRLTKPVKDEYETARDHAKPILVFCKAGLTRDLDAEDLLRSLNAKYDSFANAVELREKIRRSLGLHVLSVIRHEKDQGAMKLGDRIARLRAYTRSQRELKIVPTVPNRHHNSFRVSTVDAATVVFRKANYEDITVPTERIEAVMAAPPHEPAIVQLNGRLQWLTIRERWRFFPETPPSADPLCLGLGKQVISQGEYSNQIGAQLRQAGYTFRWSTLPNVPSAEVFFDEDGLHLTNGSQILVCARGGFR